MKTEKVLIWFFISLKRARFLPHYVVISYNAYAPSSGGFMNYNVVTVCKYRKSLAKKSSVK